MKKNIIIILTLLFFAASCTKIIRIERLKAASVPFPYTDEKNYLDAKSRFILYEKSFLKSKEHKKAFLILKDYFKQLKEVEYFKNIYLKNMKISILENNKLAEK